MSNEENPKNVEHVENEPKPAQELDSEALDQVVGGSAPTGSTSQSTPTESVSLNFTKVTYDYQSH